LWQHQPRHGRRPGSVRPENIQDTAIKLLSSAQGIDYVIVNGQLAIDQSQPTNALPGKNLRTAT
jgi:hypothetical protein